jgi:hypothetical protein
MERTQEMHTFMRVGSSTGFLKGGEERLFKMALFTSANSDSALKTVMV